jgi:hypothetical protein
MVYRGLGFLADWLLPKALFPLTSLQVVSLPQSSCVSPMKIPDGRGERWEEVQGRIKSYDGEKA